MRKLLALILGALLVAASPAHAAITLGTNGTASGNGPSVTGLNTTGNTLFGACVSADNSNGTGQTVSDNKGNTWTRIVRVPNLASNQLEFWYSLPTTVGSGTNITYSGNFATIQAITFAGTATSSILDGAVVSNSGAFSTSIQPGSITPSQANGLLLTCLALDAGTASEAINGGFTISNDVGAPNAAAATAYLIQTSATAANPTWSGYLSTTALTAMQAFKDPGGGGGGTAMPALGLMGVGR